MAGHLSSIIFSSTFCFLAEIVSLYSDYTPATTTLTFLHIDYLNQIILPLRFDDRNLISLLLLHHKLKLNG